MRAKNEPGCFPERDTVLGRIEELLSPFPTHAFALLGHRLATLFSTESLGLRDLASRQLV